MGSLIFSLEFLWCIAQLFPAYSGKALVTEGVGYNLCVACLGQALWTILFSHGFIFFSLLAMLVILAALVQLMIRLNRLELANKGEYLLFKMPFEIHLSWIMVASLLSVNVTLEAWTVPSTMFMLVLAWVSLAGVAGIAIYFLQQRKWVYPLVMAWASTGISKALDQPTTALLTRYGETTLNRLSNTSLLLAGVILLGVFVGLAKESIDKCAATTADNPSIEDNGRTNETALLVNPEM